MYNRTMVCFIRKEQAAVLALLLTIAWACVLNNQCNLASVPALDPSRLEGRWYMYKVSCLHPGYKTLVAYVTDVTTFTAPMGGTIMRVTSHKKYSNGTSTCGTQYDCLMTGATCATLSPYFVHTLTIFSTDYNSYFAKWSRTTVGSINLDVLDIFVRDLTTAAKTMTDKKVLDKVQQTCGPQVQDPRFFQTFSSGDLPSC